MKVLVAAFEDASKKRVGELMASVSDAYAKLSPKAVRDASCAVVANVKALGLTFCIMTEDEWYETLAVVRREHSDFCADYVLAGTDVESLCQVAEGLPVQIRQIVSTLGNGDFGVVWLPLDEEVLDDAGL